MQRAGLDLGKALMKARTAKKMTQKDLGTKINEKPQVIQQYECGKAVPNPQIISKLERALGAKLPRPKKALGRCGFLGRDVVSPRRASKGERPHCHTGQEGEGLRREGKNDRV